MSPDELIDLLKRGQPVTFAQTISVIDASYRYLPTRFRNGIGADAVVNEAGANEGSCKIFYFAYLHGLDEGQTLSLFGDFYRSDVLGHPSGQNHPNIRRFMRDGWKGIRYDGTPLVVPEAE